MNKDRRKALNAVAECIRNIDVYDLISELENLRDEEQEFYDNMPESFQSGDKGQAAEAAVSAIEEAISALEEVKEQLDTATSGIETATE